MGIMNQVICDDNLKVLLGLADKEIDLIYCDILYGTGRKFNDFQDLKPVRSIIEAHYRPRLEEIHRVLKETGQIYLQMDYRIVHWIRLMMDDIFGYHNFRNEIIWHYNSAPRKKKSFGSRHDTILRYSKSDQFTFNEEEVRIPYSKTAPRGFAKEKYYNPNGKVLGDVWKINMIAQNDKTERLGYQTQKPENLLKNIVLSSSNPGDLVADFYCGSGTTLSVAKKNGRKWLGVDISQKAVNIAQKRLI